MDKEYAKRKVTFLEHRVLIINQRLAKSDGATDETLRSLRESKPHFEDMLRDYRRAANK